MAKGHKTGGRKAGTPNKAVTERLEAERIARQAQAEVNKAAGARLKLGKDILEDYMMAFHAVAAVYQNRVVQSLTAGQESPEDLAKFKMWGELVVMTAKNLADFQSPKFKAIAVMAPPPSPGATLALPSSQRMIEGNVVRLDDPVATARVYSNLIRQAR